MESSCRGECGSVELDARGRCHPCRRASRRKTEPHLKKGKPSSHPSGEGYTDENGYHVVYRAGREVRKHRWVWEQAHGPIPDNHDIHHENRDKQDNRVENLQSLSKADHTRLHAGGILRDGTWFRLCSDCRRELPITAEHWELRRGSIIRRGRCRSCRRIGRRKGAANSCT